MFQLSRYVVAKIILGVSVKQDKTNSTRRKVLKTAGVAGVAAGAWHKPVINSVVSPAHAQTSVVTAIEPVILGGASSYSSADIRLKQNKFESFASRTRDLLTPPAHAGVEPVNGLDGNCAAFDASGTQTDYTHCVTLTFPDGDDPNGQVQVDLVGPDVFYDYSFCYDSQTSTYYFDGQINFSGSGTGTLSNGTFSVPVGSGENAVTINGMVDEAFEMANGTMIFNGTERLDIVTNFNVNYTTSYCEIGYGAFWSADLTGAGSCTIGSGAPATFALLEDGNIICGD